MEDLDDLLFSTSAKKISASNAIRRFLRLIKTTNQQQWQSYGMDKCLLCTMKVLTFSDEVLHASKTCGWRDKSNYQTIRTFYFHIISLLFSTIANEVVNLVIKNAHRENLWKREDLCQDIIEGLVNCGISQYKIITALSNKAQSDKTWPKDSRQILRVLYKILENYSWPDNQYTASAVDRLLTLYYNGFSHPPDEKKLILKKGVEICILNIIKHLSNSHLVTILSQISRWTLEEKTPNDEMIFELSNILETAAQYYEMDILEKTLENELFFIILKMISSSKQSVSLVGNRVLQNLIDRKHNKLQFQCVKNFFENTDYDIKINDHNRRDQEFLMQHRELIHDSFLQCVMNHCSSRINLESMYCTICLIAVEVPCGFTAAALACLIMNIQDLTLEHLDANRTVTYHIHAMVLAIMTLICWIHKPIYFMPMLTPFWWNEHNGHPTWIHP